MSMYHITFYAKSDYLTLCLISFAGSLATRGSTGSSVMTLVGSPESQDNYEQISGFTHSYWNQIWHKKG